jgi:hypothetical protein
MNHGRRYSHFPLSGAAGSAGMSMEPLPVRVKRTLRMGPVETLNVARRQVDALVSRRIERTKRSIGPRLARVGTASDDAVATFFGVLDGHTLNLQATVPPLDGIGDATAELLLRKGRTEHRAPALLRAGRDGKRYVESTAVFGPLPGRIPLNRGVWQLGILLTMPSGDVRRLGIQRLEPEQPGTGPTITDPACPDTGIRFRAVTSPFGACRIVVKPAQPAAEVNRLTVDSRHAVIMGRLVAAGDASGAVAEFRRHGDGEVRVAPVTISGDVFRVAAPLDEMAPAPGPEEEVWEIRLHLAGDRRVPVGRVLHDLRSVRKTLRAYERQILVPGLPMFHLRPQYSNAGRLTFTCTNVDLGEKA